MPEWLAQRMTALGTAITEAIIRDYGASAFLSRLSDPFWFQALGAVMGMDWHSSGVTTSVLGALKRGLAPRANEMGIYICGGRGKFSRNTPNELRSIAERRGFDGDNLVRTSRLTARIDNNAIADGFQIYLHSFVVTADGEWAVVQQGLNDRSGMARRYHWHSASVKDFVAEPHTGIVGEHQGVIMNLVNAHAKPAQDAMLEIAREHPDKSLRHAGLVARSADAQLVGWSADTQLVGWSADTQLAAGNADTQLVAGSADVPSALSSRHLRMPDHHDVRKGDVDLKRLGAVLAVAYERDLHNFAELLLLEKLGPRTLQSLALVAEVVHGAPNRFDDPARFSFAHGGKDGHPFPVPLKTYDESLNFLRTALDKAKAVSGTGDHEFGKEKLAGLRRLDRFVRSVEQQFKPTGDFDAIIAHEKTISPSLDGRTVLDDKRGRRFLIGKRRQPSLFD